MMKHIIVVGLLCLSLVFFMGYNSFADTAKTGSAAGSPRTTGGPDSLEALSGMHTRPQPAETSRVNVMVHIPSLTQENLDKAVALLRRLEGVDNIEPDVKNQVIKITWNRDRDFENKLQEHMKELDSGVEAKILYPVKEQDQPDHTVQAAPAKQAIVSVPDLDKDKARELGVLLRSIEGVQRMVPDYENKTIRIIYDEDIDFQQSVFNKIKAAHSELELKESGKDVSSVIEHHENTAANPAAAARRCPGCTGACTGDGGCSHSGCDHAHLH